MSPVEIIFQVDLTSMGLIMVWLTSMFDHAYGFVDFYLIMLPGSSTVSNRTYESK